MTDTVVPSAPLKTSTRAWSCWANALMMLVPRRAKGLALTFPPTAKEALIGFILFDVSGIAFFDRIVVLLILLD